MIQSPLSRRCVCRAATERQGNVYATVTRTVSSEKCGAIVEMSYLSTGAGPLLTESALLRRGQRTRACTRRERWLTLATPCALAARAPSIERAPRRSAKGDIDEGVHGLSQRLSRSREPGDDLRLRPRRAVRRCRLRRGAHLRRAALQAARAHRPALPLL